jgi:pilus assembly protein Flp/PilA
VVFNEEREVLARLIRQEEGAHVVEYALIIAMISIALVLALQPLINRANFAGFIARFMTCLTGVCA